MARSPKSKSPKPKAAKRPRVRGRQAAPQFPSKKEVIDYIQDSPQPVGKREIARAFRIPTSERQALRALVKELRAEGILGRRPAKPKATPGRLPPVAVIEVTGLDEDGELLARPATWEAEDKPPAIFVAPAEGRGHHDLSEGDRVLARLARDDAGNYEARPIRKLGRSASRVLGVYEVGAEGGRLRPTDRRAKHDFLLDSRDAEGAEPGELVLTELKPGRPRLGLRPVRVVERLGQIADQHGNPRALSLIAIHQQGIPTEFSDAALAEAEAAGPAPLAKRHDLRDLPLVTIDGADARDFDDAVWAEADDDPKNPGGWHLMVAIADVAHYVRPGGALDRAAVKRGNSTYFPDRVVPMLPEALSNGWCSLRPDEERPCMAVHLWIDKDGQALRHRFVRGLMRSAARLTYEQVQAARDGSPDAATKPLAEEVIAPLYGAFEALLAARHKRGTLELDRPERQIKLAADGSILSIEPRPRLDSHRLIEEFMIAANVAAAAELERLQQVCMYRLHEPPDPVKIEALGEVLRSFDIKLARGQVMRPRVLTGVLQQVAGRPEAMLVSELVLRAQSQAYYGPKNVGHFGLALPRYAHFTSPIRRYADLLVHRALITGLKLGAGGLPKQSAGDRLASFTDIGSQISASERRSMVAERDATDRFTAAYLQDRVGAVFAGRINGVTRFGLFVTLDESGADGLVPISSLPDDYYDHDERQHCLVGRRWGQVFRLGEPVRVLLREAEPMTGSLLLELERDEAAESMAEGAERSGWDPLSAIAKKGPRAKRPSGAKGKRRPKKAARPDGGKSRPRGKG